MVSYCIEIPLQILVRTIDINSGIINVFCRSYLILIIVFYFLFTMYVITICLNKANKNYDKIIRINKIIMFIVEVLVILLILGATFTKYYKASKMYIAGPAVDLLKLYISIQLVLYIILLIINHRTLKNKKYLPIYLVIICLAAMTLLTSIDPSVLISNMIGTFICYTIFFTIENPDLKMLRETEAAKIHAEKANRAKSDFLSSMSHEIKTPLNAIVGFSEDIRDYIDSDDKARIKEDSELILASSETLLEIVGNILDISKIESEKMDIVEGTYHPKEEFEKLAKITATQIGDKPIKFNLHIAEDMPYELRGDSGKVKQVINNLLTNAIKYTDEGEINLRIDCINQNDISLLKVSCQDTGRGIKKESIEKLFTKFERLDAEKNSTTEGTGLGLAITKHLVEMMGGNINVSSQFGKGSIFVAQIPQRIKTLHTPVSQEMPNVPATPSKKRLKNGEKCTKKR